MRKFTVKILLLISGLIGVQSCADDPAEIPQYLDLVTEVQVVDFEEVFLENSAIKSYRIAGNMLNGNVNITSTAPFTISSSASGNFSTSLSIAPEEFASGPIPIYVKYEPTEQGVATGEIVHSTEGLSFSPVVEVTGSAIQDISQIANLLVLDNFDYSVGPVPTTDRTGDGTVNAGMEGWLKVRTGNASIDVVAPGLEYTGYTGSGVGNAVLLDMDPPGSNSNVYAQNFSEQQTDEFTGSFYTSFMIKVDGVPAEGQFNRPVMFVDWLPNGATLFLSALQVNNTAGDIKFGIKYGPGDALTTITPEIGQTYIAVLKHTVTDTDDSNSNNTASLYIFSGDIPETEPEVADATMITPVGDTNRVRAISLVKDNSAPGAYVLDGLKVATTWEDLFK